MNLNKIVENIDDKKYMISLSLNKELRKTIEDATSWMDDFYAKVPFKIRCLAMKNQYSAKTFPKCPVCGNPVSYNKAYQNSFNKFCSDKCSKENGRLSEDIVSKLQDREWLYEQRLTLRKSIELIANELGCSESPVREYIKKHKLPNVRYNESNPVPLSYLRDRDWLIEEHKIKRRKLKDIADEIGSSSATVSVWLKKHNVESNEPNSYDRPNGRNSVECDEVFEFIRSLNITDVERNNRSILCGLELDLVIPSKNIAIEYNGLYHHVYRPHETTFSKIKDSKYHHGKTIKAAEKGYTLFHIFSDDWVNPSKKKIWKSILKSKLHVLKERIFARKCTIVSLLPHEKNLFLDENHLQGRDKSTINYALKFEDRIVALMTFSKSRYSKKHDWELVRFCPLIDTNVVGGFSKLLSHFRKNHKGSIVSYADRSRSLGNVYEKNGFTLTRTNPPSYWYVNFKVAEKRLHRTNFMKSKITSKGDLRTEAEIMVDLGYDRIWDCGTLTFVLE